MSLKKISSVMLALGLAAAPIAVQAQSDSYTFLKAVRDHDTNQITTLVDQQPSIVNSKDYSSGDTALHLAVKGRDNPWLAYFLYKRTRVDVKNKAGQTPLMLATQIGWDDGAQLLLESGADPNLTDNSGQTPLIIAVQNHNIQMVRLLIDNHADPRIKDHIAGRSAIDYAGQDGRSAAILKILDTAQPAAPKQVVGPMLPR
ncbi:MAG: ankyrin repeat domain-containing protein [Zymomonas mobilis]|uniref:Ankyrin repeat protein n=1 Tax=Zymomonas mobilis TaxID=542 RepID=A0A542VZ24_ZYMMB|nr:ankyrin repeat domain-containing protein [Zymomonas mobilis]TQL16578.1 ankyrin repeat protein [Zymomonas mobilis]